MLKFRFKILFLLFFSAFAVCSGRAQNSNIQNEKWVSATINNGDTIPLVYLSFVDIKELRTFKSAKEREKYNRLKYNVQKVYPYAKLASALLKQYEDSIANAKTEKERKKFYKQVELDLRAQYEHELMNLSVTQGRILIKLIDRETGNSSYELLQDLRNVVTAFFWQGLARLFGHDLKSEYDPNGADKEIEQIVLALELG